MTTVSKTPSRVLVLLVSVVLLFLLLASAVQASGSAPATSEYRVESGDTLWAIALEVGERDADVRRTVFDIRRLNGLSGSVIHPGQVLLVPAGD